MKATLTLLTALLLAPLARLHADGIPQSVAEIWSGFDPRKDALETEMIRQWEEDGSVMRYVRFVVGTFEGKKVRMAAYYGFPKGGTKLPAIEHLHGGGQQASKSEVLYWNSQGYASLSINWGEKVVETPTDPNTDWAGIAAGFLAPKHHNDVSPAEGTLYSVPHPLNSSWTLMSMAARRGLTFLEHQPEVDGMRLGLTGHSMGGELTVLTASDPRVKAATPSVGGSGYLTDELWGLPGSGRQMQHDRDLFNRTVDPRNSWPLIHCPILFLGATNDFNSPMELVVKGFNTLPATNTQRMLAFSTHLNHHFRPREFASRVLWFETHLKQSFEFPKLSRSQLKLDAANGVPIFEVTPDTSTPHPIRRVEILYGYGRDPRTRFWRSADVTRRDATWSAACPAMALDEPLFVHANITYEAGRTLKLPAGYASVNEFTVTGECLTALPDQLAAANVRPQGGPERLIDDFKNGWRDWGVLGIENHQHWNVFTHKVSDPAWIGPCGGELAFEIETAKPGNTLAVVMETDAWRSYTGRKPQRFIALVKLADAGAHSIRLPAPAFLNQGGEPLRDWNYVTGLIFTPGNKELPEKSPEPWNCDVPAFRNLRWEGGEFVPRPKPYAPTPADADDANARRKPKRTKKEAEPQ
jgi:hypothetical protein